MAYELLIQRDDLQVEGSKSSPLDVALRKGKYERIISLQNVTVALPFIHRIMDKETPTIYLGGGWELLSVVAYSRCP